MQTTKKIDNYLPSIGIIFNKFIQKEKNELDKSKIELLKKENEERALYIKLHEKYGDMNKFQV